MDLITYALCKGNNGGGSGGGVNIVNFVFTFDEDLGAWSFTADKTGAEICAMTGKVLAYCADDSGHLGTPCWINIYDEDGQVGYYATTDMSFGSPLIYYEIDFGNYDDGSGFVNDWTEGRLWHKVTA